MELLQYKEPRDVRMFADLILQEVSLTTALILSITSSGALYWSQEVQDVKIVIAVYRNDLHLQLLQINKVTHVPQV